MIEPAAEDQLAADFAKLRPYLLRVAYSHLGSLGEAEDIVQEAWIRLERTDRAEIRNPRAWLTTVVSRLALDALTSARGVSATSARGSPSRWWNRTPTPIPPLALTSTSR